MEIDKYLEEKHKEIDQLRAEVAEIVKLRQEFSDLEVHINRWEKVRFWSPSVNPLANDAEINHSCGCCSDSPLLATPVLKKEDGTKVYGTPEIFVGQKNEFRYGDTLDEGWEEKLREKNVSDVVIEKVRLWDTPVDKNEDEDDWDDEEDGPGDEDY